MPRTPLSGEIDEGRRIISGSPSDHKENGGGGETMGCGPYSYLSLETWMQRSGKEGRQVQTVTVLATGISPTAT